VSSGRSTSPAGPFRGCPGRHRYDGIRARTSEPQLTAVELHLDETAAAAVELLLRLLSGQDTTASDVPLPVLVPRASSAVGHTAWAVMAMPDTRAKPSTK
jgi:hypothetical protein